MTLEPGDRIELLSMPDDPDPLPAGSTGTVTRVAHFDWPHPYDQVSICWDNGRSLALVIPPDRVRVLPDTEARR